MKKIVIYGSHLWAECPELKEFLSEKEVKFAYFDISLNLAAMKRFLKIRDNNSIYDSIKKSGGIGIPTVIIDNEIIIDIDKGRLVEKISE